MCRRAWVGLVAMVLACAAAPGSAWAIAANGSFVQIPGAAPVYVVVGGAAVHVDSCAPLGGCPNVQPISSLAGYAPVPANGSFVRIQDGPAAGFIGVVVGGAVIHVDSCAPLGGCPGWVGLDVGGAGDYMAAHPVPYNGSFVRIQNGPVAGWIGVVVGGALIHVDSCAPIGCARTVGLDAGGAADYMAAHPTPADGSYVRVADGAYAGLIARTAGGAFLPLTDCAPLGGCPGWVSVDSGGLTDYVRAHPRPADGTVLRGLPSGSLWVVLSGERAPTTNGVGAVDVDDTSLAGIPVAAPAASGAAATSTPPVAPPPARSRTLAVRMTLRWRWNRARTQLMGLRLGHHPHGVRIAVSCRGRGCPLRARATSYRRLPRLLDGGVYRAGDRLLITLSARGYARERVEARIRNGRIPRVVVV